MIKSLVAIGLVVVIFVFLTMLAYLAPWKYDMTEQKLFTLSGETVSVADSLGDTVVRIGAVYPEGNPDSMVSALLNEYAKLGPNIEVSYLDVEKNPSVLAGYNIGDAAALANGTLIVNSGGRYKLIRDTELFSTGETGNIFYGESELTGAIRYVTTEDLPTVYFVQGHDEVATGTDMSEAVALLERNAYAVDSVTLLQHGGVPAGASVLIFASPKKDLDGEELDMVREYINNGGKILLMLDPVLSGNDALTNFSTLASDYGVGIANSYVYEEDPNHYMTVSNLYLIPLYGTHEITVQLINGQKLVVLPLARGLSAIEGASPGPLLQSSPDSWMRTDMGIASEAMTDADTPGPVTLAYAASKSNAGTGAASSQAVIIGDSNFATNEVINMQANSDLFINSVNWLTGGREADIIAGKVINAGNLVARGGDFNVLMAVCCVVMPAVMFVGAALVWRVRKNK